MLSPLSGFFLMRNPKSNPIKSKGAADPVKGSVEELEFCLE